MGVAAGAALFLVELLGFFLGVEVVARRLGLAGSDLRGRRWRRALCGGGADTGQSQEHAEHGHGREPAKLPDASVGHWVGRSWGLLR